MSARKPRLAFLRIGVRSVLSGEISAGVAAREYLRRGRVALVRRRERTSLDELPSKPAQLLPQFQKLPPAELLKHFRERNKPSFLPGFATPNATGQLQRHLFPKETETLIGCANQITQRHRWALLGFGEMDFGEQIDWNSDPLSGRVWPLDFHADIPIWHNDGSDIRVLWELNRLGHFITLGRAYAVTEDEIFAEEFFGQLADWHKQNPVGRGANWSCAMEVALRAMNLLAAFTLFRFSPAMNEDRLSMLLAMFEQHGAHIRRNLEFSYVTTSNHYLSDLTGLLWLGIMLPELSSAEAWKQWALNELLREMDKQILPDGTDYEASTGYHRLVLELFLYSFSLCKINNVGIDDHYWQNLHSMFKYLLAILRPDGLAPLIGDTDGGQVLPITQRRADDHAYLLSLGAVIFRDPSLKLPGQKPSEELLWGLGAAGHESYESLPCDGEQIVSKAFPDAGTYILRNEDLFLLFNASGPGMEGRGAHGHNDALSIEVSACGRAFLVDPGTYVYSANLAERHTFRSTAYHSTLQVDDLEQNVTNENAPFSIGDEAHPNLLRWESNAERDLIAAEHSGYERLREPVRHSRTIIFEKAARRWIVEDELFGSGKHQLKARFHFDAGLDVESYSNNSVVAHDEASGTRLFIRPLNLEEQPQFEPQFTSRHYGSKLPSVSACWTITTIVPCTLRWAIVPFCAGENELERLAKLG